MAASNDVLVLNNLNDNIYSMPEHSAATPCLVMPLRIANGSGSPAQVIGFLDGHRPWSEYTSPASQPAQPLLFFVYCCLIAAVIAN